MNSAPPKMTPATAGWVAGVLLLAGGGAAAMVYFFNPSTYGFYPVCQFHRLTGLNCPGCGGTRALYALLHGEWRTALRDNALVVTGLAAVAMRGGWFGLNHWRGRPKGDFFPARYLPPLLLAGAAFTVLRNLPAFAFLSP